MEVVFVEPGKTLRLFGGLGPLQGIAATGPMTFALSPVAGGTRLELTYTVAAYAPQGVAAWAAPVDAVLSEQLTRLKNYIETGNPAKPAAPKQP
jgi:hypothetical protein